MPQTDRSSVSIHLGQTISANAVWSHFFCLAEALPQGRGVVDPVERYFCLVS